MRKSLLILLLMITVSYANEYDDISSTMETCFVLKGTSSCKSLLLFARGEALRHKYSSELVEQYEDACREACKAKSVIDLEEKINQIKIKLKEK